jgi:hypothetical protein
MANALVGSEPRARLWKSLWPNGHRRMQGGRAAARACRAARRLPCGGAAALAYRLVSPSFEAMTAARSGWVASLPLTVTVTISVC